MGWDPTILRKYTSTTHFRLLNQVRSELKAQPLIRNINTKSLTLESKPFRGTSSRTNKRPNSFENNLIEGSNELDKYAENASFKDRLNNIQLR